MPSPRRGPTRCLVIALLALAACADDGASGTPGTESEPEPATTAADPGSSTTAIAPTEPAATPATEPVSEPAPEPTAAEPEPPPEPVAESATYDFSAISPVVQDFVDQRGLNGAGLVIVHRDDGVVHEEHWGVFTPDRVSLIASSSKMITAGVLLRLDDDGLLDIDAPVADVAAWGSGNPEITPAQLLSNSSGLVGLLPEPAYVPYVCQFIAVGTLQECGAAIFTAAGDDGDVIDPDTSFRYGGAQWQVAGAVAEVASGKSWSQLIEEIYVEPCGLDSLAFNNHFTQIGTGGFDYPTGFDGDPTVLAATDNPNLEGGAYVTTGDYATLLLMHLRGGLCDGNRVLSEAAVDRMHEDRIGPVYGGSAGIDTGYGMGWWVDRASGRISDGGAYGTVPWLDLEDGYGAYLVVEADAVTGNQLAIALYDLVDNAVNAANDS